MSSILSDLADLEDGITMEFTIEPDEDGYIDRECPNPECLFQFKVNDEDWTNLFTDEAVHCPLCNHTADSDNWSTREQLAQAEEQGLAYVTARVGAALDSFMEGLANDFNRGRQGTGLVSISMQYRGGRSRHVPLPSSLACVPSWEQRICCRECTARYSVIGAAFFCPSCGHSSAEDLADAALRKVRLKVESLEQIRDYFAEAGAVDDGEVLARSLLETAFCDCVVVLQRTAESLYSRLPSAGQVSMNAFQRIDDGSALWVSAAGRSYEDWLGSNRLERLRMRVLRRHLLAHTDGMVDARYLSRSGAPNYVVGQRIVVRASDVIELADDVETLLAGMRAALA